MSIDQSISAMSDGRNLAKSQAMDGQELKQLVEAGMTWLRTNQQIVNALNVFPVPDGDTGTNMLLTMQAAYAEICPFWARTTSAKWPTRLLRER